MSGVCWGIWGSIKGSVEALIGVGPGAIWTIITICNTTSTNVVEKDVNLRIKVTYFPVYDVKAGAFEQKWEFL